MKYETFIKTISEIVDNDDICTKGLSLTYELPKKQHLQLNQEMFYKYNDLLTPFIPQEEFVINVEGIITKFVKAKDFVYEEKEK